MRTTNLVREQRVETLIWQGESCQVKPSPLWGGFGRGLSFPTLKLFLNRRLVDNRPDLDYLSIPEFVEHVFGE